ncbi:VWFA domain-containing protein [Plasmodiophora brassicae]
MAFPTSAKNPTSRNFIVREAIGVVMSELKGEPSQDSRGSDRGAGLRAITFAGGHSNDIGELNPENLQEKWDQIVWGGMTYLMPGWLELNRVFDEEFGRLNADHGQPPFMAVVVTDGEAPDIDKFELALTQDKRATLVIICVGYGEQHQYVLRSFHRIAESNPRVKVVNFVGNDDPNEHAGSSNA